MFIVLLLTNIKHRLKGLLGLYFYCSKLNNLLYCIAALAACSRGCVTERFLPSMEVMMHCLLVALPLYGVSLQGNPRDEQCASFNLQLHVCPTTQRNTITCLMWGWWLFCSAGTFYVFLHDFDHGHDSLLHFSERLYDGFGFSFNSFACCTVCEVLCVWSDFFSPQISGYC